MSRIASFPGSDTGGWARVAVALGRRDARAGVAAPGPARVAVLAAMLLCVASAYGQTPNPPGAVTATAGTYVDKVRVTAVEIDVLRDILLFDENGPPDRSNLGLLIRPFYYCNIEIVHVIIHVIRIRGLRECSLRTVLRAALSLSD